MDVSNKLTGGMVVSRALQRYGVQTIFALAGAAYTHLLEALDDDGLNIISTRHESGTVLAADGYARVTGKLGVALILSDQGLPSAMTGIATAFHACSPVVILTARLPDPWYEPMGEADPDQHDLIRSVTKWSRSVSSPERLDEHVDAAAKQALSGRPGPVVLAIPLDCFAATVERLSEFNKQPPVFARPAAEVESIERAADLIEAAERPLIVGGAGAAMGDASEALTELCRTYQIPYFGNTLGRGQVPEDDEISFPWSFAHPAAGRADLVISIGARFKQFLGYGMPPRFDAHAKFIQVDIVAEELNRMRPIDVPIVSDAGAASRQLLQALGKRNVAAKNSDWVREELAGRYAKYEQLGRNTSGSIHPYEICRAVNGALMDDGIYVGDGGDIQFWMFGGQRIQRPRMFLDMYPFFSVGVGIPLALGAAAAARDIAKTTGRAPSPVVLVTGDGAFGFYCSELGSFDMAGLPAVVIVGNDGAWGMEVHGQRAAIDRSINTQLKAYDYQLIAQAYGCEGARIEEPGALKSALANALQSKRCTVLNVIVDQEAGAALKTDPHLLNVIFDDVPSMRPA